MVAESAKALTFMECAAQYITMREPGWKDAGKSAKQWRASLKTYVYPTMGSQPVAADRQGDGA